RQLPLREGSLRGGQGVEPGGPDQRRGHIPDRGYHHKGEPVMRIRIALLTPFALAACVPFASLLAPIRLTAQDVPPAASVIAAIIRHRLPPGREVLRVEGPADDLGRAIVTQVTHNLRAQGYAIEKTPRAAHKIAFAITPLETGALLTVTIDGGMAATL